MYEKELDRVGYDKWKTGNGDDESGVVDVCDICDTLLYEDDNYHVKRLTPFDRKTYCETCYLEKKEWEEDSE